MLLVTGAIAGMLAGLLGIGGGIVIVPALSLVFIRQGVDTDILIKVAIGTSLATIVVTAISSIWVHHRKSAIYWDLVKIMTPGVIAGSFIGATMVDVIPGLWLSYVFVLFLLCVAAQMVIGVKQRDRPLPAPWVSRSVSVGVGIISSMMGIGGGSLHVPYFGWHSVPVKHAIATAATIGFPLAIASTSGFILAGLDEKTLPPYSLGYVSLPAFGSIVVSSVIFAPLGAKLAHALPDKLLKRIFATFLSCLAINMAYDLI